MRKKILVLIGLQREYVFPDRLSYIASINASLKNVYTILQFARGHDWPVIYVQHIQEGESFNRASEYADFIDGFFPVSGEIVVCKNNYSCFSSSEFERFVQTHEQLEFIVVGYGTNICCLATIVDAYSRGYHFAIVEDATAALATDAMSEELIRRHAIATLSTFARVTSTQDEINI